jgi:phenylalanyl-tRNA synthetase beta chain
MKISDHWLREWVSPKLDAPALAERLTLSGLEVGSLEAAGGAFNSVIVGEIVTVNAHPNAERLKLCLVDVGRKKRLGIVSGAENAVPGLRTAIALAGATLADGTRVEQSEIRGVVSAGMLCSATELGLTESSTGILALDSSAAIGQDIRDHLALDDTIYDIELTPNRGDCLSVAGIAREVAALTRVRLRAPTIRRVPAKGGRRVKIRLQAKGDCPLYVGRVIEAIDIGATTPVWMSERLRRAGVRSINAVVDVTNYVMLELGQPMHAFDLDRLSGDVTVRRATEDEPLKLLDGVQVRLKAGTLVIADAKGAVALAGIMGGFDSAVSGDTRNIFLESAYFDPQTIAKHARGLGLQTESSYRFERGVDPQLQSIAIERATALLKTIVGGKAGPATEAKLARYIPRRSPVLLRSQRIKQLLDVDLPHAETKAILNRLGMRVSPASKGWRAVAPSWRFDIEREVDLIEEIARVHGYHKLPTHIPRVAIGATISSEREIPLDRFKAALVARDYQEVITYSFVDPELQSLITPERPGPELVNPISSDMAVMRASLWPGLLQTAMYNRNRQQQRLRLFEVGRCFTDPSRQDIMLGGLLSGAALPEQWGTETRQVDFFDAKGDLQAMLRASERSMASFRFAAAAYAGLHPGQQARVLRNDIEIGQVGALHPDLLVRLGLEVPIFVFEIAVSALQQTEIPRYSEISKFPAIRRDIAVVVDDQTPARAVLDCVKKSAGKLLVDLQLFDEYRGEGIDSGRKSLALGLTLQDSSRTLKEEVVEAVMERVIHSLQSGLGGELRKK